MLKARNGETYFRFRQHPQSDFLHVGPWASSVRNAEGLTIATAYGATPDDAMRLASRISKGVADALRGTPSGLRPLLDTALAAALGAMFAAAHNSDARSAAGEAVDALEAVRALIEGDS